MGEDTSIEAKRLRRTLHHLSARNRLITAENKGLRSTVMEQKTSKKKRATLDLQQRKEYRSPAVLYSPRKVREARFRARVNEQQHLKESIAKHYRKEQRAATALKNKLEKEEQSERYKKRLEASRLRQAEEQAEKQRKAEERASGKAIQLPQLGKRTASKKASIKLHKKVTRSVGAKRGVVAEKPAPAPRTHTTRSGRVATQKY